MKGLYIILAAVLITSCQNQSKEDINKAKQASIDSMKVEINKQRVIDSMKTEMAKIKEEQKVESQKEKVVVVHQQAANGNTATTTTTTKKKGWSATAKGAVIGAGVGAATGAIVSKKKGEGAIIGGLAGAALGTGTGAVIDSKKKKEQILKLLYTKNADLEILKEKTLKLAPRFMDVTHLKGLSETDSLQKATVVWGIKESVFKIKNEVGISFKDHIFESDFNLNDKQCKVTLRVNNKEEYFDILFDFIEDYVFVCAFNSVSLSDVQDKYNNEKHCLW